VLVASAIAQDEAISSELSLLNRDGSTVEFGDLLMLPIGDSILWVRPLYVAAEGDASVPTLQRVIATVGEGERITIASNLTEALNQLFDGEDFSDLLGPVADPDPDDGPEPGDDETPPAPSTAAEVLAEVASLYDQRQEALTSSPPDEIRAAELLARIGELLATVEELDVEPEPAPEPTDSDEVDA
jgi:uncharacterized membrane protein (UPF0182 family)